MKKRKRRRKLKIKNITIFVLIIMFIPISITFVFENINDNNNDTNKYDESINKQDESKVEEYTTNLIMVGDALVHESLYKDAYKNGDYKEYDFKPYLELIKDKVSNYDLAYYNQETILGGTSIGLSTYPAFNSPQE